jgi:hypothetical protein
MKSHNKLQQLPLPLPRLRPQQLLPQLRMVMGIQTYSGGQVGRPSPQIAVASLLPLHNI